jgi:ribosomal protein S18 acetylase RimI-like enzyme
MIIKDASLADIPVIQDLAYKIWPVAYRDILSKEQLQYMLENFYSNHSLQSQISQEHHFFLIAFDDNSPIAFASYSNVSETTEENRFKLHKLYILPGYQGKGVGKSIIQYIFEKIKSSVNTTLVLNVNRFNNAVEFYKRIGFRVIKEEDIDIGNGFFMNDFVMEKKIEL